jgi:hypothetical protein
MKYSRELTNGFIIFLGISIYYLIIEFLGLSDQVYLRMANIIFVIYGINRTIKMNHADGIRGYNTILLSAVLTSFVGAILSVGSLLAYIEYNGGVQFLTNLSKGFIFGGGELTIYHYCIGLLFESIAASLMVSFILMQYWKGKVTAETKTA